MRPRPLHLLMTLGAVAVFAYCMRPTEGEGAGRGRAEAAPRAIEPPAASRAAARDPATGTRSSAEPAAVPERPASLRGTEVDGGFDLGPDGRFLPTARALRLFDYFLSTLGELDLRGVRALVAAEARELLPASEVPAALSLFDRYVQYQARSATMTERADPHDDLLERLEALEDVQETMFGPEDAGRMFGERNATREAALQRRAILSDPTLSESERAEALAAVEAALPERLRSLRERLTAPIRARAEVAGLRAAGASEEEVFAARAQRFGEGAATRLAAADARRAAWEERVAEYREARDALRAAGATEEALATLRAERFEGPELLRVEALDRIERSGY